MAKTAGKLNQTTPKAGRHLGIKKYGGEQVIKGNIIVRQRGSEIKAGEGIEMGKDFTLFAVKDGKVNFRILKGKQIVEVI
jgi:large subunit ribosomal protein L27